MRILISLEKNSWVGNGAAVDMRATAPNWPTFSDERDKGVSAGFVGTSSPARSLPPPSVPKPKGRAPKGENQGAP